MESPRRSPVLSPTPRPKRFSSAARRTGRSASARLSPRYVPPTPAWSGGRHAPGVGRVSARVPVFGERGDRRRRRKSARSSSRRPGRVTRELPEALAEWKAYAEKTATAACVFRRQGLLDWPLVKDAINCAVACPVASLRSEIRRCAITACTARAWCRTCKCSAPYSTPRRMRGGREEAPASSPRSDDSDDSDSEDDDSEEEDSEEEDSLTDDSRSTQSSEEAPPTKRRASVADGGDDGNDRPASRSVSLSNEPNARRRDLADDRRKPDGVWVSSRTPKTPTMSFGPEKETPQRRVRALRVPGGDARPYKLFSRFLRMCFAKERTESDERREPGGAPGRGGVRRHGGGRLPADAAAREQGDAARGDGHDHLTDQDGQRKPKCS